MTTLQERIEAAEGALPVATNHAILRYQERIEPLPMEEVRRVLDTDDMREAIAKGCQYHTLESGHRAIIAGRRIVTILQPGMRPKGKRARKADNG